MPIIGHVQNIVRPYKSHMPYTVNNSIAVTWWSLVKSKVWQNSWIYKYILLFILCMMLPRLYHTWSMSMVLAIHRWSWGIVWKDYNASKLVGMEGCSIIIPAVYHSCDEWNSFLRWPKGGNDTIVVAYFQEIWVIHFFFSLTEYTFSNHAQVQKVIWPWL